ncbi:MAG: ASPIC/UnbV domain-containing protein, partial [Planctomycetes bacterium]|nr:ASPIC/UnbV domain-containing protein [Planctomycetota bacterium]
MFWRRVASQSPSITADAAALADPASYLAGWAALAELVDRGYSWSGHERHCVFVNRGGAAGFADVSALSGLDFADDGRACVALDLDGDGDRDLVFKNRSGPQLRMLTNVHAPGRALAVRLRGVAGSHNTGAIGARVELVAGDRRLVRCVTAGDGYLGQASRWLHFGLAGVPAPERLRVCWPGGVEQEFAVPPAARRLVLVQGGAAAVEGASPSLVL